MVDEIVIDGCAGLFNVDDECVEMKWHANNNSNSVVVRGRNPMHSRNQLHVRSCPWRLAWLSCWESEAEPDLPPFDYALIDACKPAGNISSSLPLFDGSIESRPLIMRCHLLDKARAKSVCVAHDRMNEVNDELQDDNAVGVHSGYFFDRNRPAPGSGGEVGRRLIEEREFVCVDLHVDVTFEAFEEEGVAGREGEGVGPMRAGQGLHTHPLFSPT